MTVWLTLRMDSSFHSPVCLLCAATYTISIIQAFHLLVPCAHHWQYFIGVLLSFLSTALISLMSLIPNVPVSLHPFSLCVTCHLSLHSPQPNISIMDMSDHVSVFLCPSPFCSSSVFRLLTMSCNIVSTWCFALVFALLSPIPLEYTNFVLCLIQRQVNPQCYLTC